MTDYPLRKRELARRENIARIVRLGEPILRCTIVEARSLGLDIEPGMRVPYAARALQERGMAWSQLADLRSSVHGRDADDAQLIVLHGGSTPRDVLSAGRADVVTLRAGALADAAALRPDELARLLRTRDLDLGDFDAVVPRHHLGAAGHFSYAHAKRRRAYTESFSHTSEPLSAHADWDAVVVVGTQDATRSGGSVADLYRAGGTDYARTYYANDAAGDLAEHGPDYTVRALLRAWAASGSDYGNAQLLGRLDTVTNYHYRVIVQGSSASGFLVTKETASGSAVIASTTIADGTASKDTRLEMLGSQLKAYRDGVEKLTPTDSDVTGAGYAGLMFTARYATTSEGAEADDWEVYVEPGPLPVELFQRVQEAV
jgi:hypothetical protein